MHETGRVGVGEAKHDSGSPSEVSFDTQGSAGTAMEMTERKSTDRKCRQPRRAARPRCAAEAAADPRPPGRPSLPPAAGKLSSVVLQPRRTSSGIRRPSGQPGVKRAGRAKATVSTLDMSKRHYEQWQGRNVFLCGGRLMLGAMAHQLLVTFALIMLTWGTFIALVVPLLEHSILLELSVLLMALQIASLLATAFTDPGILPRRPPSAVVESMPVQMKERMCYCSTCHIVKAPRVKHCRVCDNCVQEFDHHCPWVGNCIGVRNYRFFLAFVITTVISTAYVLSVSLFAFLTTPGGLFDHVSDSAGTRTALRALSIALVFWTLILTLLVGALVFFHCALMCMGQTTNEYVKGARARRRAVKEGAEANLPPAPAPRPAMFAQGVWRHCCTPGIPSVLPAMHRYPTTEDQMHDLNAAMEAIKGLQLAVAELS